MQAQVGILFLYYHIQTRPNWRNLKEEVTLKMHSHHNYQPSKNSGDKPNLSSPLTTVNEFHSEGKNPSKTNNLEKIKVKKVIFHKVELTNIA